MDPFDRAVHLVLEEEGGLSDHARDPGGRTNLGITQETLDYARRGIHEFAMTLPRDVDRLSRGQAKAIYRELYWHRARCEELPEPAALLAFDAAVQHGPRDAIRQLQWGLGVVADGAFGPKSRAAVGAVRDWAPVLREMAARRAWHYMKLDAIDDTFGLGWSRRLFRMYEFALALHAEAVAAVP